MADYVRGRITAAKIGVGLVLGGLITGLADRARTDPQPVEASRSACHGICIPVCDPTGHCTFPRNSIDSAAIKNHSLLYKDAKSHQFASYAKVKKAFIKIEGIDGEAKDHKHTDSIEFAKVTTSLNSLTAKVRDQVIQGHGGVFSGMQDVGNSGSTKDLLSVPDWITVQGVYTNIDQPAIRLRNLASYSFVVNWNDGQHEHQDTLAAGSGQTLDLPFATGDDLITAQLLSGDGRPITLTLSRVGDSGGQSSQFVAQALAAH